MKLTKSSVNKLFRELKSEGLFNIDLRYEVKEATGTFLYSGPKIPPDEWRKVLSFFKWTYDTYKSESQVRLFVSPKNGLWRAWAFPQEGGTGMTTKEIENEDFNTQRAALFERDEEWIAWGTVHHHCSGSAFQSFTDESDEKNQGGLHITVGDMDKPMHSIHCRFYHQGDLWEPDMSVFWEVGDPLHDVPKWAAHYVPKDIHNTMARNQMCVSSSVDFPAQWRANYIIKPPSQTNQLPPWKGSKKSKKENQQNGQDEKLLSREDRALNALEDCERYLWNVEPDELEKSIALATDNLSLKEIINACIRNQCDPEDMLDVLKKVSAIQESQQNGGDQDHLFTMD